MDFVDPVVQLPGRTITVKALVPNPRRELQSGMFIEVRLATAVRPSAVVIAEDAVLPLQGTNYVWVAIDGKALAGRWSSGCARRASSKSGPGSRRASRWSSAGRSGWPKVRRSRPTLVDRTPASGQESVGGTTPAADTAGRAPAARDTAASRADSAVAESAEAGASQGR